MISLLWIIMGAVLIFNNKEMLFMGNKIEMFFGVVIFMFGAPFFLITEILEFMLDALFMTGEDE